MRQLNWLGVVLGLVVAEVIGYFWYGSLFKDAWIAAAQANVGQADTTTPMIIGAIDVLVMMVGIGWLVSRLGWNTLAGGAKAGLIAAVAFIIPGVLMDPIYAGRSSQLMLIEGGYVAIACVIAGALIGAVRLPARKVAAA
jgi:hypothetical protein